MPSGTITILPRMMAGVDRRSMRHGEKGGVENFQRKLG